MIPPLLVLAAWPFVIAGIFAAARLPVAIAVAVVSGYLLLPHDRGFDLPLFPQIDKDVITALTVFLSAGIALLATRSASPRFLRGWLPRSRLVLILLAFIFTGLVLMVVTNREMLVYGSRAITGLSISQIPALMVEMALPLLVFLLGRKFLANSEAHKMLLTVLMVAGIGYSFLALYEIRMSPQLNIKLYGYFQHIWNQHERGGGYRPIVFLQHGLWVSLFFSTATLAALGLFRGEKSRKRLLYLVAALWLFGTLVLTKSLGALMVTMMLAPLILFAGMRIQLLIAAIIAAMVMTYPMMRGAGLVPLNLIANVAAQIDNGRAASLAARLQNEDLLLEKAQQKPLFGWGRWGGRSRVYDENGRDISVTDGTWIIFIGSYGWIGYLGRFGLLAGAIVLLFFRRGRFGPEQATATIAIALAGNLVDLIPNAGLTPITWLMAGSLYGRIELGRLDRATSDPVPVKSSPVLTRFGPPQAAASGPVDEPAHARRFHFGSTSTETPAPHRAKKPRPTHERRSEALMRRHVPSREH